MTTTIATGPVWMKFSLGIDLIPGDEVKLFDSPRQGHAKTGIVERTLTKNIAIVIKDHRGIDKTWRVPPSRISHYAQGDASNIPASAVIKSVVSTSGQRFFNQGITVGDVIMLSRGCRKVDVVKVTGINPRKSHNVSGRDVFSGKVYGFKTSWFVQKLDASNFLEV